jgi:hypothetical protein
MVGDVMSKIDALMKTFDKRLMDTVSVIHSAFEEAPHVVAFVEVDKKLSTTAKLEKAFMLTNTINDAWWNNKEVTKMFGGDGCRSTSVGDMVLIGKEKYKCEKSGWELV